MDIRSVFMQMLVLLILLLVGVAAAKFHIVDTETNRRFTRFTLVIPQSCMILSSVMNVELDMTIGKVMTILGAGCLMFAILIGLGYLVPLVYRVKPADRGVYRFMEIFGNVGFMGYPVVASVFGGTAVFYASLMNIPFNILAYTLGIALMKDDGSKMRLSWRQLVSAPLVATAVALLIMALKLPIPAPVADAVGMLGDMIVPLSMIIIGASLGDQSFREIFGDWRTYAFAPAKLIAAPLIVWALLRLIIRDPLTVGVTTVLSGMPVAAVTGMFAIEYGRNQLVASRTIFVTTVLSVATIPLVCWLLL